MMQSSPESEGPTSPARRINLLDFEQSILPPEIIIPGAQIGAADWPGMISQTGKDGKERALVVSSNAGKLMTSRIFVGRAETKITPANIHPPFLPHGIKSLLPGLKDIAYVHTHPKPPELDHIQTTIFSEGDIRAYYDSLYPAMVMIDKGGVHILLRTFSADEERELPNYNLDKAAFREAGKGNFTAIEVIQELSKIIYPYGLRYYYSSTLESSPRDEILLKKCKGY